MLFLITPLLLAVIVLYLFCFSAMNNFPEFVQRLMHNSSNSASLPRLENNSKAALIQSPVQVINLFLTLPLEHRLYCSVVFRSS